MIKYDKKETRANRHNRKVTLRFPILRQVQFFVTQKSGKDGVYMEPEISMSPSTFTMQGGDELSEWRVALTRAHEIWAEMNVHTGTKARGFLKGGK